MVSGEIDLLRFDAEGSEGRILHGSAQLLARSPRVRIVTEWSTAMLELQGTDPEELSAWLHARGFKAWKIEADGCVSPLSQPDLPRAPHCDVVFAREDLVSNGLLRPSRG